MVQVRVTRLAGEVLAGEGSSAAVTRLDVQSAAAVVSPTQVRTSRISAEVLGGASPSSSITRLDVQAALEVDAPTEVQATRLSAEVLASQALSASVTRLDVQIGALFDGVGEVRISRLSGEALAREGARRTLTPLALADDAYLLLHNWVTAAEMVTSFLNDVTYSPDSGAESRRGLGAKPSRELTIEWLVCDKDIPLERFEVLLRRMTEGRFQVPIYMDQVELAAAYSSADTVLSFDTTQGRWFEGMRVAVVQLDAFQQVADFSWHLVEDLTSSSLTLSTALGRNVAAGSLVFPVMDCEASLELETEFLTARVARFTLRAIEAPGASQLPATRADTPDGFDTFQGAPIWVEQPDWTFAVSRGRLRHGSLNTSGRAAFLDLQADRARVTHSYEISGKRDTIWPSVQFFETRRGRLRSFWHVDIDSTFRPVAVDASGSFVSVSVLGTVGDLTEEFEFVGVVMTDGRVYVREVANIQLVSTVYRISLETDLPSGLNLSEIARISRARRVRFVNDDLTETWTHTDFGQLDVSIVETLDERNFES